MLLKQHWPLLNWKGDDHTAGVFFDEQYGYMVERTYAVRMKHVEPAPPVFFTPRFVEDCEDEATIDFPYQQLTKRPNKYQLLFTANELKQSDLPTLFPEITDVSPLKLPIKPLIKMLEQIPKKRVRDLCWLRLKVEDSKVEAGIFQKKNGIFSAIHLMDMKHKSAEPLDVQYITINSNVILHALKLFSWASTILIFKYHDRIIVTSEEKALYIEAVIALPKTTIQKEIEELVE